jgi:hypothetical protein
VLVKGDVPSVVAEKKINAREGRLASLATPGEFAILQMYLFKAIEG